MRDFRFLEINDDDERFYAARGISGSDELFYKCTNNGDKVIVEYRTNPPENFKISENGFCNFFAYAMHYGIYDINYSSESLHDGWNRIPDEHSVTVNKKIPNTVEIRRSFNFWNKYNKSEGNKSDLIIQCRNAFDASIKNKVKGYDSSSCEFSGGIDSSIVLSSLLRLANLSVSPITLQYPFFEFKYETLYQDKILKYLKKETTLLNFDACLPYFGIDKIPRMTVPSMASTSYGFFSEIKQARHRLFLDGPHFNGHGGDRLFSTHPLEKYSSSLEEKPNWLSRRVFASIKSKFNEISFIEKSGEVGWNVAMIDPPWTTKLLNNSDSGSAFLSREFIYALRNIWESNGKKEGDGKKIAMNIFSDRLPSFLWDRSYKTDHIGTAYRGAVKNRIQILKIVDENLDLISEMGIDPIKYKNESINITSGIQPATRSWGIVISILAWFHSNIVTFPSYK